MHIPQCTQADQHDWQDLGFYKFCRNCELRVEYHPNGVDIIIHQ